MLVWTRIFSGGVLGLSGRIHNIVDSFCVLCRTLLLLYKIKIFSLLYDTLQLSSHNILMENKEVWDRPGMTCVRIYAFGRHGRSNFPMSVDCSVFPSGKCMTRGRVAGWILLSGDTGRIKRRVAPESAMAWLIWIFFGCVEQGFLLYRSYDPNTGVVC